ncbi:carbohydrate porin [Psychromonas ossibalaenae]|uniref:carbohydrate porin n=1 Tax=Psychromonas ossibalaenae TaxID=444922 RepID=UPI00038096E6|nr:carbohydrate porin [Psychromonas ossibalaenae]
MKFFKISITAAAIAVSFTATAGINIIDNEKGIFSIGGDVEFDLNYQEKTNEAAGDDNSHFDQTGRILIELAGERNTDSGYLLKFKAQPLMDSSGVINLDDSWFSFGIKDSWEVKLGRFEAYDMFPVGQDTFLEYSGDTANDLYTDNAGYMYQVKEGRGRGGQTGQLMYSQTFGNLYTEVSTMIGDRSDLFTDTYHGKEIEGSGDSIIVRPVIAYQINNFRVAASMEANLVKDAITFVDGSEGDVGNRIGYGLSANYTQGDLSVNVNVAYLDALNEADSSLGLNVLWKGFGVGYIHGVNDFDAASGWHDGKIEVQTAYTSYEFADIFDVEDFSIYVGAYHTNLSDKGVSLASNFAEGDDMGGRLRFKYLF